jgi:hypothetical protein
MVVPFGRPASVALVAVAAAVVPAAAALETAFVSVASAGAALFAFFESLLVFTAVGHHCIDI